MLRIYTATRSGDHGPLDEQRVPRAYDRTVAEPDVAPAPLDPDPTESATLALLRVLAASADDAFIFTDLDARVTVWNAAAERLYGIAAGDALGQDIYGLTDATVVGEVDIPSWLPREIALATGAWHGRVIERPKVGRAIGREVVVEATLSRFVDERGDVDGILNIKRDITASYRLERELATLGSLATATGQARTMAEIAQSAIDLLCTATGAPYGVIIRIDGDRPALEAAHGVDAETSARALELTRIGDPMLVAVEPVGRVVIGDLDAVPIRPDALDWLRTTGLAAIAAVGIHRRDDLVGVLAMGWTDAAAPRPSSATLLQASAHVERALENARLVEEITYRAEAERALLRRLDTLDELTRIGQTVLSAEELAEQSARLVGEALEANGTAYGLFNRDGSGYETSRTIGVRKPIADWLASATPSQRSVVRRWQAGEGSVLERFEPGVVTAETLAIARESGVTAYAAIPIRIGDELVGGIVAYFEGAPDELIVNTAALDSVARIVGISLANFRHRERFEGSEARYRTLFEASPDAFLMCDLDGTVLESNGAAARLFGLSIEAMLGRPVGDFLDVDPIGGDRRRDASSPDELKRFPGTAKRADDTRFPMETEASRVTIGGRERHLVLVRDLTEQQRLQAELVQAQKMETVGILVSGVAHELNNPIASIIGLSTLIGRDPTLSGDLRESAGLLVDEAQRAGQIVRTFLDFVRSRPPERHPTAIAPLLETVRELQSYSQKSGVEWIIDVEPGLPRIAIDRSQIQQVLINLTSNAIQAILTDRPTGRARDRRPARAADRRQWHRTDHGHRRRPGCRPVGSDEAVRAVLHDQGAGRRDGARPAGLVRHRPSSRRPPSVRARARWSRGTIHHRPAGRPRFAQSGGQPRPRGAAAGEPDWTTSSAPAGRGDPAAPGARARRRGGDPDVPAQDARCRRLRCDRRGRRRDRGQRGGPGRDRRRPGRPPDARDERDRRLRGRGRHPADHRRALDIHERRRPQPGPPRVRRGARHPAAREAVRPGVGHPLGPGRRRSARTGRLTRGPQRG